MRDWELLFPLSNLLFRLPNFVKFLFFQFSKSLRHLSFPSDFSHASPCCTTPSCPLALSCQLCPKSPCHTYDMCHHLWKKYTAKSYFCCIIFLNTLLRNKKIILLCILLMKLYFHEKDIFEKTFLAHVSSVNSKSDSLKS